MNGYSNTGFTHTLNGIYSITDGAGTTIEMGEITTTDLMSDSFVTGNIGCGNLNSSNNVSAPRVNCDNINCKTITADTIYSKNQLSGFINLGIAPYLTIPLTTTIYDTTTGITNYNLSTYLTNANNNTIMVLPYYAIEFFNNNKMLKSVDNSSGSTVMYNSLSFNLNLTCTKIVVYYKNNILL